MTKKMVSRMTITDLARGDCDDDGGEEDDNDVADDEDEE